jgi:hypothetical protein
MTIENFVWFPIFLSRNDATMILVGVRIGNAFDAVNMEIDPKN